MVERLPGRKKPRLAVYYEGMSETPPMLEAIRMTYLRGRGLLSRDTRFDFDETPRYVCYANGCRVCREWVDALKTSGASMLISWAPDAVETPVEGAVCDRCKKDDPKMLNAEGLLDEGISHENLTPMSVVAWFMRTIVVGRAPNLS